MELRSDKGIEELRFQIIRQACDDYIEALKYLRNRSLGHRYIEMLRQKEDCERFFRSEYFSILCDLDGFYLMKFLRGEYYNRPLRWGKEK